MSRGSVVCPFCLFLVNLSSSGPLSPGMSHFSPFQLISSSTKLFTIPYVPRLFLPRRLAIIRHDLDDSHLHFTAHTARPFFDTRLSPSIFSTIPSYFVSGIICPPLTNSMARGGPGIFCPAHLCHPEAVVSMTAPSLSPSERENVCPAVPTGPRRFHVPRGPTPS